MAFVQLKNQEGNLCHFNLSLATMIKLRDDKKIMIHFGSEEHYEILNYQQDEYDNLNMVRGFLNRNL